jgi:transposase-like protein
MWCIAILEWAISTGSVSAAEISRKTGLSHPSAWKMLMKIRGALVQRDNELLQGMVESDEAWFGRKENQHIVLGLVERYSRKLRFIMIPNVKEETLYPHILEHVQTGSRFFTDSRLTYSITGIRYEHQTVNHSKHEFARDIVHTNTIEQIWGMIKGIIRTIHHGVSAKYRHLYLAQFAFRYQNEKTSHLFFNTLCQIFRPTYCLI